MFDFLRRFYGGNTSQRGKLNALVGAAKSVFPWPGNRYTSNTQGAAGQSQSVNPQQLRSTMPDKSPIRMAIGQLTAQYPGIGTGQTGYYVGKWAKWKGKASATHPDTEQDFTLLTGTVAFYNLNENQLSTALGTNKPPQLILQGSCMVSGFLMGTDGASMNAKKVIVGAWDGPAPAPGIIVATGPGGAANFTSANPQQYWVQQANDTSSDTGNSDVTLAGMSNAPIWAVTNLAAIGPRLATGTMVEVFFTYNAGGYRKCFISVPQIVGAEFAVALSSPSGSVSAGYSYTVKDLNGNTLGTGISPDFRLFAVGTWNLTGSASTGTAYYDASGTIKLKSADETWSLTAC